MDLSPDELDLIALAREGEDPSQAARKRMRANVMTRVGVGAAAGATVATTTAAAQASSSAVVLSIGTKLTLGAVVLGALGGGGYVAATSSPAPPPLAVVAPRILDLTHEVDMPQPPATEPKATEVVQEAEASEPESSVVPAAPSASGPAAGPAAASKSKPSSIKDELALLREAQQRLNGGNPDEALSMLEDHQRNHPDGRLKQERMAVRVFALCGAGRRAEARAAARRFLAEAPNSPLAPRVARACTEPTPESP